MSSNTEEKDFSLDAVKVWRTEDMLSYILEDLETRAKKDVPTKLSVLATGARAAEADSSK